MSTTRSGAPSIGRRFEDWLLRVLPSETRTLVVLVVLTLVLGLAILELPLWAPITVLILPMVVGSLVLGPRQLPWFVVFVLLLLAVLVPYQPVINRRVAVTVLVVFTICFIILLSSFRRSRLGVAGLRGESMLVDLRDRILKQ